MRLLRVAHYTLKTVAYALCAGGCIYQIATLFKIYFSYPSTVLSLEEIMDTLKLPAISICNNNRIMLAKLRSFDVDFNRTWSLLQGRLQQKRNVNRTKMTMQRFLDRTIRSLMDQLPVSEFARLGHRWTDLLPPDYFKCATDPFNLNNKCIKYANAIETAQSEGNCFTMFGRSENEFLKKIAVKSGLSQSPVIRGTGDALNLEIAEQPFHPNEIIRILVNFSVPDYTTNDKVMGYVAVHDQNELPPIRERNFVIYPGYFYEIYVTKESGKYLPKPYATDCVDYALSASDQQGFSPKVLSRDTCIMNCMAERTVQACGCWPPELPYVLGGNSSSSNSTKHALKWCSWRDGRNVVAINRTESSNWFHFCFANQENDCRKRCKIQCEVNKYEALRQSFVWPSDERMEHSTRFNLEFRKCCAIVSLRFWSSEETILKYEPRYEFAEFSSYFGGLLSVWVGFSLVKTYDILELIVRKIIGRFRSKEKTTFGIFPNKRRDSRANRPRVAGYIKTRHMNTSI